MNNLSLTALIATSPSAAFTELRDRPKFLFPLLAIVLLSVGLQFWYFSSVDIEWLKDHLMSGNAAIQKLPEADRARVMGAMSRNTLLWSSVLGSLITIPAMFAIQALYYLLAGKVTNLQKSFVQWFAIVCWSSLPIVLGAIVGAIMLAMHGSNAQMSPSELQPLSLNELFFHRLPSQPGYAFFLSLSVITLLTWGLRVIGVRAWSDRSWVFSTIFALLPFMLLYGVWALIAL